MVDFVTSRVVAALSCRKGVTALEYGVIAAGIVLVVVTAVAALGPQLTTMFTAVGDGL
ncbi:Flp family type IVb pilin [Geminicoccus roseus]|uniref:Flp family type IVb pilin n=1 Tax=Geminicoccus roseus TaxID=404900 RepID=UPI0009FFA6B1|nr:Flp family type IVb pilin [Geminicoccus roseus]